MVDSFSKRDGTAQTGAKMKRSSASTQLDGKELNENKPPFKKGDWLYSVVLNPLIYRIHQATQDPVQKSNTCGYSWPWHYTTTTKSGRVLDHNASDFRIATRDEILAQIQSAEKQVSVVLAYIDDLQNAVIEMGRGR